MLSKLEKFSISDEEEELKDEFESDLLKGHVNRSGQKNISSLLQSPSRMNNFSVSPKKIQMSGGLNTPELRSNNSLKNSNSSAQKHKNNTQLLPSNSIQFGNRSDYNN